MGKQGPCYHCGVTSTPLWRNGPPEKPVLCNACGSRWRTKGTLANYTPLHARVDPDEYEDHRLARMKNILPKKKHEKSNKRKLHYEDRIDEGFTTDYSWGFQKNLYEDTSNRSSSGSAISNSESCAQFGSADVSDLTGLAQSIVWDAMVPSKKRTCVTRPSKKQSSIEKLTKDLYNILQEQNSQFSCTSEEELLFESKEPMVSVEIGHGSVLMRHPSSIGREEESEASSFSVDNKRCGAEEGSSNPASLQLDQANRRDKSNDENLHNLWARNSPLCNIDLTEVVDSDLFWGLLTADEQEELFKYLPSVDNSAIPESLRSMFGSSHFRENLFSFQQLLAEGVFDTTPRVETGEYKSLKILAMSNLTKCKWVERYNLLKSKGIEHEECFFGNLVNAEKLGESKKYPCPESKTTTNNPKRPLVKGIYRNPQNEDSYFTPPPGNVFALQTDGSFFMPDSFEDESSDQDLLLDVVPSNGSFPEAEFLHPAPSSASKEGSAGSSSMHPPNSHT